jgi:hypothetical protein
MAKRFISVVNPFETMLKRIAASRCFAHVARQYLQGGSFMATAFQADAGRNRGFAARRRRAGLLHSELKGGAQRRRNIAAPATLEAMRRIAFVVVLLFALALSACIRMSAPTPATAQAFASAPIGQPVELVVRVDSLEGMTLRGRLAEQVRGTYYRLAGPVTLSLPRQTPVSMGTLADIRPNSIIFVNAIVTGRGAAEIKKAVVLTPFVHIE